MARIQQKSNLDSECCHHVITVTETLPSLQLGLLEAISYSGARAKKPQCERELSPELLASSQLLHPKMAQKKSYHTLQTTFCVKEVMDGGGKSPCLKKSLSDKFVHTIKQRASPQSIRVGNQGSILRKLQFHSVTQ